MGKHKNVKPDADLEAHLPAGSTGAENLATAGAAGTVSEVPADAVSAAPPAPEAQPAVDAAGADQGQPVPEPAVAAGPQETETEGLTDGQAAQAPADGEQDCAAQGAGLPPGETGQPADLGGADGGNDQGAAEYGAADDGLGSGGGVPGSGNGQASDLTAEEDGDIVQDLREMLTFDIAELARSVAAGGRLFANHQMAIDYEQLFTAEEAEIMVAFVRDNPEAPLLAMYNHLRLTKRYPETAVNNADMLALTLFHAAVTAALDFERKEAAEKAAAEFAATPAGGWPGERAFKPEPGPFDPVGLSATR